MKIKILKINELYLKLDTERSIHLELAEQFCFFAESYKFNKLFKDKLWDGKIKLYNVNTKLFPSGLLFDLLKFCKSRGYEFEFVNPKAFARIKFDNELIEFAKDIPKLSNRSVEGIYNYQFEAFKKCIEENKMIVLSPTACLDENTIIEIKDDQKIKNFLENINKNNNL